MPDPIPYMKAEPRWWRRRKWRVALWAVGLLLLFTLIPPPSAVSYDEAWICAECGSRRSEIRWIGGLKTAQKFQSSPLDLWIAQNAGGHTHDWRNIRCAMRDIFGHHTGSSDSTAPPMMSWSMDLQAYYLKAASTEQIRAFVQTMCSGSEAQQQQAVLTACDDALTEMGKSYSPTSRAASTKQ